MAKIMLVEDDNNLRSIYGDRLVTEGHQIVSAGDGEEALAMAVKEKPDLIIADVMMPKISGFDMLDILRSTPETKNTKVIMMTALSQAEDKARADKLGADKYLVKSQVTLDDVARIVNEVLIADGKMPASSAPAAAPTPEPVAPTMQNMSVASAPSEPVAAPVAPTSNSELPAEPASQPATPTAEPEPVAEPPVGDPVTPATPAAEPAASSPATDDASLVSNTEPLQTEQQEVAAQIDQAMTAPAPEPAATMTEPAMPPTDPAPAAEPVAPAMPTESPAPTTDPLANFAPPVPNAAVSNDMHTNATPQSTADAPALGNGPALGDRVVQPLPEQTAPKPDLNQLYQNEMAKEQPAEAAAEPTNPPAASEPASDAASTPPPADPGNISL